jgi:predicted NUDIX family NTP pyrophosphohydrolase
MPRESAGLLPFRERNDSIEVFLVHPGGPFWAKRSEGAWSIPKGELSPGESPTVVALREFEEETGMRPSSNELMPLGSVRQAGGKVVHGWAIKGDFEIDRLRSNTFEMEWPPRSGKVRTFPEVDRAAWFDIDTARQMIIPGQRPLIERLVMDQGGKPLT